MRISNEHWVSRVRRCPSPNHDERCDATDISLIVVHCISLPPGKYGGPYVSQLFCNELDTGAHPSFADLADTQVSAHVLVDRRGRLTQYVPFNKRAWHAGVSTWARRNGCNNYAIGIELEGVDEGAFTAAQYRSLTRLTRALFNRYPRLSASTVVGHNEIASGRKTDPGPGFDWPRYYRGIR